MPTPWAARKIRGLSFLLTAGAVIAQTRSPAPAILPPNLPPGLYAVINTSMGTITTELYEKEVPNTVRNFIGLARGTRPWLDPKTRKMVLQPLYDNITFHRVIPDFMVQTGDPTGTGAHNCGFLLPDEIVTGFRFDRAGRLAMANTGAPNSGACQFFITDGPYPAGNGKYTIFGQVVDGQKVIGKIAGVFRDNNDKPRLPVKLIHVAIVRVAAALTRVASGGGRGFFLNAAGYILTAAPVIEGCTEMQLPDGTRLEPPLVDRQNQLALVRAGRRPDAFAVFRAGNGVTAGEAVWAAGVAASVSVVADTHGDTRYFQLTLPAGSLGSPVLDASGKLVGILAGSPEGAGQPTSLAVKASVAMGFLDSAAVSYVMAPPESPLDPAAVVDNASKYTVEIECWK
jgi:peptidyl-prolyl cis-trans isomerase A (cyclophilin A)